MAGLTDKAGGGAFKGSLSVERAQQAWEESMLRQMETLREAVRARPAQLLSDHCGGTFAQGQIRLTYWGQPMGVTWPEVTVVLLPDGVPASIFDTAMLLYYLDAADGAPLADAWIGYRELPGGAFYNQAFQTYSGDRLARAFGENPEAFRLAARTLDSWRLTGLAEHAYAFKPLPRIRLAAVLWPGDEDFPAKAQVLFDAAASHYMTTDGLALLGAGLAGRLIKAQGTGPKDSEK